MTLISIIITLWLLTSKNYQRLPPPHNKLPHDPLNSLFHPKDDIIVSFIYLFLKIYYLLIPKVPFSGFLYCKPSFLVFGFLIWLYMVIFFTISINFFASHIFSVLNLSRFILRISQQSFVISVTIEWFNFFRFSSNWSIGFIPWSLIFFLYL